MSELRECPFCGGKAKETHRFNSNVVTCTGCGAQVKQSDIGYGDAAKLWNRRPSKELTIESAYEACINISSEYACRAGEGKLNSIRRNRNNWKSSAAAECASAIETLMRRASPVQAEPVSNSNVQKANIPFDSAHPPSGNDAEDAGRYRWLRQRHVDGGMVECPEIKCWPAGSKAYRRISGFGAELDRQIDRELSRCAAMSAEGSRG